MRCQKRLLIVLSLSLLFGSDLFAQVTIDTECEIGPEIEYFGWDLKGGVNRFNPPSRAQVYFGDTPANLARIPVFANDHFEDGTIDTDRYENVVRSLENAWAINPDVKVFASIRLEGANTYPEWIESTNTGNIFGNNVFRPVPALYARLLTDYVEYFWQEGVKIDFFGILNETNGSVTPAEYIDTVRMFEDMMIQRGIPEEFRSFEWICADSFRVQPSIGYTRDVLTLGGADTIDIGGAHMYSNIAPENDDNWFNLADELLPGTPLWHTEVHLNRLVAFPDVNMILTIRNAYSVLSGSARSGVSSFVFWADAHSDVEMDEIFKRKAVQMMVGSTPVYTSPVHQVQFNPGEPGDVYHAYRRGNELEVVLFRDGNALSDFHVDVRGRSVRRILEAESFRGPGDILGTSAFQTQLFPVRDEDRGGFTLTQLPADSFTRVKVELGEEPEEIYNFNYESNNQFDSLGGRRFTGFTTSTSDFNPGADAEFGSNVFSINSNIRGNNAGVGFMYLPTGVAWEPNTRYTINVSVLDRAGQPDDGEIEFGLWAGLPADDNGGGAYAGDLSGSNAVAAQTQPSLGTAGQLVIASDSLDSQNGLANGEWSSAVELGCVSESAEYQQYTFATPNSVTDLEPMILFLRSARNGVSQGTGTRVHFDQLTISKEPLQQFIPVNSLIVTQGFQLGTNANLEASDDQRLRFMPSKAVAPGEHVISMVAEANAAAAEEFLLESKSNTPNLTVLIEFFNWTTNAFEIVDADVETITDELRAVTLDPASHVNPNGTVRSRVSWIQSGPLLMFPFNIELDQLGWVGP